VIKLETAHIEEVRGIRKLDIDFRKEKFAISGPNGSGKSGVIDAIEFGLTGQIGRLIGRGTGGLSVAEHGPHVDKTRFPDAAFVRLQVYMTELDKSVTITRKISAPKKPRIEPSDDDVKTALSEVAEHPEIALSRREILRFILVEPTKRSEEIQAILKLDEIGQTRGALNTAQNRLQRDQKAAEAAVASSRTALQTHLQIATLRSEDVSAAINQRRALLGLMEISEMTADTKLDAGLSSAASTSEFNKRSALRDLGALSDAAEGFPTLAVADAAAILADLARLEADPSLFAALQRRAFIEKGLELVDGAECPLCDAEWEDEQHLRDHLTAKLLKSDEARKLQQRLLDKGAVISREIIRVTAIMAPVQKLSEAQDHAGFHRLLARWKADLDDLKDRLESVDALIGLKDLLTTGWLQTPHGFAASLKTLTETVDAKPDQTATIDAQTFLTTAQLRLGDYREARRRREAAEIASKAGRTAYAVYCSVMDDELNSLYEDVQEDFSKYYRIINEGDESGFIAKLTPSEGKLDFDVNFYERGLFPPGAFHSEGHQDGMGVCLYLALMKRLFGDRFTFALLGDVVMSVDAGHRYNFCKLLKTEFPDTQFIITTHDRLWAEQMKSAGLVTRRTSLAFHSWTIDTGPLVESNLDIWDDIAASLAKGKVEAAAAALRHHLEYVSRHLADELGAPVPFRADGNYELGDLLPAVLTRMKGLLGKAADAAQSWGNNAMRDSIVARRTALSNATATQNVEQWAVNRAVHYNEWANFGRKDFEPVVAAFKDLLACFACPSCGSWFHITPPRGAPETLRCSCAEINLNLMAKVVTTTRLPVSVLSGAE
jgi:hypothetical protein